jgi:molybdate transport repressor ModE-like protein
MDALRIFVEVAQTGSFSRAAERCFVSQSAVSQRVRALERELGQVLVERGKGRPGAQLTEAGARLLEGARDLLARADALRREITELSGEVTGTLHVATVYSIGLHALPPSLSAFLAEYPQVHLRVEYLRTDRIYESLLAGAIDLGIVACPQERPQVEVVPLREEPMVLILPPAHPLAARSEVPLAALAGMSFVAFDPHIPTRRITDDLLRARGVAVDIVQAFDNIETIKRVVEIGLGVAIVPEPTVGREVRDGTLAARPLAGEHFLRPTGLLLRKGRVRSNALVRFVETLQREQPRDRSGARTPLSR